MTHRKTQKYYMVIGCTNYWSKTMTAASIRDALYRSVYEKWMPDFLDLYDFKSGIHAVSFVWSYRGKVGYWKRLRAANNEKLNLASRRLGLRWKEAQG